MDVLLIITSEKKEVKMKARNVRISLEDLSYVLFITVVYKMSIRIDGKENLKNGTMFCVTGDFTKPQILSKSP